MAYSCGLDKENVINCCIMFHFLDFIVCNNVLYIILLFVVG
jgi:hypothetical protein